MSITLDKIIEASKAIQEATPPEKVVVLGFEAYQELGKHIRLVHHPEGRLVHKLNGIECHYSLVIPPMNYMLLSREEFEKFTEDEQEFLNQNPIKK